MYMPICVCVCQHMNTPSTVYTEMGKDGPWKCHWVKYGNDL